MAFRWRADDGPTLNAGLVHCSCVIFQGIRTSIAKKPYTFVILGGMGPDPCPPLVPRMGPFPDFIVCSFITQETHGQSLKCGEELQNQCLF